MDVSEAASILRSRFPFLSVQEKEGYLLVGTDPEPEALRLEPRDDEWIVSTAEWHGHEEDFESAFGLALRILAGFARTAQEFRGEKLSGTWLETWDGEAYEMEHHAVFLNVFDREEWFLRPGERWKVDRVHRRLIDHRQLPSVADHPGVDAWPKLGAVLRFTVEADEPLGKVPDFTLKVIEDACGEPEPGTRWTTDYHHAVALMVPVGWRRADDEPTEGWNQVTFQPEWGGQALRVRTAFRDSDATGEPKAVSCDYHREDPCSYAAAWLLDHWETVFEAEGQDYLVDVSLLTHLEQRAKAEPYRELLEATVRRALPMPRPNSPPDDADA